MQSANNLAYFQRLQDEQIRGLEICIQKISQWTKFREDYVALQKKLQTLPDKISYDVKVPFGSVAFMLGKMIHTNEVLVLLGDEWFAEQSAKQAAEIVGRRITSCDATLRDLEQERQQFENWMESTKTVMDDARGGFNIIEEYDEEKETLWREQHRISEKRCRQMAKDCGMNVDSAALGLVDKRDDESLWARLDVLESQELKNDEMSKLEESSHSVGTLTEESAEASRDSGEMGKTTVKWEKARSSGTGWRKARSNVTDEGLREQSTLFVTFTNNESSESVMKQKQDVDPRKPPEIVSPGDIYKMFGVTPQPELRLKSILKRPKESSVTPPLATSSAKPQATTAVFQEQKGDTVQSKAFSGTIVEHDSSSAVSLEDTVLPKRVSKFRAQRQSTK